MEPLEWLQDRLPERLDALLSSHPSARRRWFLPEREREDLEPLLDVADDLARVRKMLPLPAFADNLEARLLARARRQATGAPGGCGIEHGDCTVRRCPRRRHSTR
jgi:hypothetical protein